MQTYANGAKVKVTRGSKVLDGAIVREVGAGDYVVKTNGGQMLAVNEADIELMDVEVVEEPTNEPDFDELMALNRPELVQMCKDADLKASGTKQDLAERLIGD